MSRENAARRERLQLVRLSNVTHKNVASRVHFGHHKGALSGRWLKGMRTVSRPRRTPFRAAFFVA